MRIEIARTRLVEVDRRDAERHGRADIGAVTADPCAARDAERGECGGEAIGDRLRAVGQVGLEPPDAVRAEIGFARGRVALGLVRLGIGLAAKAADLFGTEPDDADRPPRARAVEDALGRSRVIATPLASSIAPVPRSQLSRCPPTSTIPALGSVPGTSAITFPDSCVPVIRGVRTSVIVIGLPRVAIRSISSASGTDSAADGIGVTPSGKLVVPVCGLRWWSVPIERITIAAAPLLAAIAGPTNRAGPNAP